MSNLLSHAQAVALANELRVKYPHVQMDIGDVHKEDGKEISYSYVAVVTRKPYHCIATFENKEEWDRLEQWALDFAFLHAGVL